MTDHPSPHWKEKSDQFALLLDSMQVTDLSAVSMAVEEGIGSGIALLRQVYQQGRRVFVIGNGGSAAVASHIVNDFVNCGRLKATTVHDPSLFSCMSNDYGYEQAYARILEIQADEGDLLVAISSSGNSANIRNAADIVHKKGGKVMTLSGFKERNPLRAMGELNYWLPSEHYGFVEIGHLFVLHHLLDRFKEEVS